MKRYGYPLLVIVAGSLVLYAVSAYIHVEFKTSLMSILSGALLFVFGCYLSQKVGRKGWLKKLIVVIAALLLLMVQMNILTIRIVDAFMNGIGASVLIYDMLYIYLGYIFF